METNIELEDDFDEEEFQFLIGNVETKEIKKHDKIEDLFQFLIGNVETKRNR